MIECDTIEDMKKERREHFISIRVTKAEKDKLEEDSYLHQSVGAYLLYLWRKYSKKEE